jgi:hypothetical protein
VAAITGNLELADTPGNVLLGAARQVRQLPLTGVLTEHVVTLARRLQNSVDEGLRTILELP